MTTVLAACTGASDGGGGGDPEADRAAVNTPVRPLTPTADASINGVLPPDRRTTWKPGVTYAGGGIPARTQVCQTLSPSGRDDTPAIQKALDSCPADQTVQLSAGTFKIYKDGLSLRRSGVTLRGAGSGAPGSGKGGTRLVKVDRQTERNHAILYVGNSPNDFASSTDLAADAVKGTNTLTLTRNPGVKVGEFVLVDHVTNKDPDVVWGKFHDGPGGGSRRWFDRQDRSISQILEVTAVDGEKITFETPFHWTFKTDFKAQLSRYGESAGGPVRAFVERAGIEDIYFYGGMGGDYHGNVSVNTCAYCWVKSIESDYAEGTAVGLYATYRSEIRDSYIHGTSNPNPGGGGYLTGVNYGASENLIENNILWKANKMIVMRASGGGNVIGYNYMQDGYGDGYKQIQEVGLNAGHYTTPHMELLEGNEAFNADGDSYWGNSIYITLFRNHLTATRANKGSFGLTDQQNKRAASLNHFQYYYNFVGNVLGSKDMKLLPGQRPVYEVTSPPEDSLVPMWQLGYVGEDPGQPFDKKVAATIVRHGNFDYVSGKAAWLPALPSRLPPSLYLTGKPAFFGTAAWPWVTPENAVSPVATLPARARFEAIAP